MARTVKQPAERKMEIVDAARRLFYSRGYAKTTITEIIDEVEVSKGLFYYYFGSKEDILDEIVTQMVEEDVSALREIALDPGRGPGEQTLLMFREHLRFVSAPTGQIAAHLRAMNNPELVIRTLRQGIVRLTPLFVDVIERGVAQGIFEISDPFASTELLLYACTFEAVFSPQEGSDARGRAFVQLVERALGAKPGSLGE
ncbi:TetR/AcrR family transcriptional regulator [Brooklawnia cerclae]|uniref:AcrR family transcriptional regulator n=1 Tax=Brooklawnia cerclae TaxID=349934 RepID=A0ABX0SJL6_9ACTN|nr:TetR/AcrR family transcriptional regulator [Brooklawnia cerclae]NIH56861.1 AcrR family transcriptional regulator [Brooklawnia cerclae]